MALETNIAVAVDVALATVRDAELRVLVYRRRYEPAIGTWALPGVLVRDDEPLESAAARALHDKVGLDDVYLEQLYTFGAPGRDTRGRVIAVSYSALVGATRLEAALAAVADDSLALVPVRDLPALAFDHDTIVERLRERLRGKVGYTAVGYELLPPTFTLRDLRLVHEAILGRPLNKDSFRRRLVDGGELEATGTLERGAAYRPAELYRRQRARAELTTPARLYESR